VFFFFFVKPMLTYRYKIRSWYNPLTKLNSIILCDRVHKKNPNFTLTNNSISTHTYIIFIF